MNSKLIDNPRPSQIEVLQIKLLPEGRQLKAFVDIRLDDWIIRNWRVTQQNGGRILIEVPQTAYKNKQTGELKFISILTLPPGIKQQIDIAILQSYRGEVEEINGSPF